MPIERARALLRRVVRVPETIEERNLYFLHVEVVFASVLAAAATFNSAYILRLGGSNALVGLLTSLPALIAICCYLPSARILERRANYLPLVVGSLVLSRIGYLLIAALPSIAQQWLPQLTVGLIVAMAVPAVFFATGWSPLLSEVIPSRSRASVLSWRSILSSATIAPLIFLAGRWLDRAPFPANYQWLYAVGAMGGLYGAMLVARIRLPLAVRDEAPVIERPRVKQRWLAAMRAAAGEHAGFTRIVVNTFLYNLGAWLVAPLFIIFYVRELGAGDGWVGILGTVAHVGVIVGYALWRRIIRRVGEHRALLLAVPFMALHAPLVALVPNLTFILFVEALINVLAPGVNLSHSMLFLDLLPEKRKHSGVAVYSMIMNVGAFVCPLLGVALANALGLVPVLIAAGVLRLLGAALFYLFPLPHRSSPADVGSTPA